jgi:hypothetical protein
MVDHLKKIERLNSNVNIANMADQAPPYYKDTFRVIAKLTGHLYYKSQHFVTIL